MSDHFKLTLCQGKYEYEYTDGMQTVWRNGELWTAMNASIVGNKFVYSMAVELDEARKEITQLREQVAAEIKQRPKWAYGFSNDSVAAQVAMSALQSIWEILGVSDQTAAMQELKRLSDSRRKPCRSDGRCQYAIDVGMEAEGHCPPGKCNMPQEGDEL